mmetsp:Transcript_10910/g.38304  ORF Transcript_10910/g.38304 Transcript_10910/m.38304 type:complete len:307 (-) Transcript_10910:20-940(-)
MAQTRFKRECDKLLQEELRTPIVAVQEVSDRHLRAEISGPDGSPFCGQRFSLVVSAGNEYPFKPPVVRFASPRRVYHPNVCPNSGGICLDILNDINLWSPAIGLEKLLVSVASLLSEPRTEHGLNAEALELLRQDPDAFCARAAAAAAGERQGSGCIPLVVARDLAAPAAQAGDGATGDLRPAGPDVDVAAAAADVAAGDAAAAAVADANAAGGGGGGGEDDGGVGVPEPPEDALGATGLQRRGGATPARAQAAAALAAAEGGAAGGGGAERLGAQPLDRSGACWGAVLVLIVGICLAQRFVGAGV